MSRNWTDTLRAAAAFAVATVCGVCLVILILDRPGGASDWWSLVFASAGAAALAAAVTAPVWRLLVSPSPGFWRGCAAGVLAVLLGHATVLAGLSLLCVPMLSERRFDDLMFAAVVLLVVFGLSSAVATPIGGVFGGLVGVVQHRRQVRFADEQAAFNTTSGFGRHSEGY